MSFNISAEDRKWIDSTFEKIDKKLQKVTLRSRDKLPYTIVDGAHDNRIGPSGFGTTWWTNGFWGGMNILMYEATGNEEYLATARRSEELLDDAWEQFDWLHHDVGFMWHILSGADYRLTGDQKNRSRNLLAASILGSRYSLKGDYIRAWNGKDNGGWTIVDCMMNIPLLYWASRETGDSRYEQIARKHADMTMRHHVREDGSVAHICVHDIETGELLETRGGQGYGEGSSWTRGCGWALYGFILSYIHTGDKKYLDTSKKVANYVIANLASDEWLPRIDFRAPKDANTFDSTAGVIYACGLIEIAKHVPEYEQDMYIEAAMKILRAMEKWMNFDENEDYLLGYGSGSFVKEVHIPIIYGDYYLVEALCKLRGRTFLPW